MVPSTVNIETSTSAYLTKTISRRRDQVTLEPVEMTLKSNHPNWETSEFPANADRVFLVVDKLAKLNPVPQFSP